MWRNNTLRSSSIFATRVWMPSTVSLKGDIVGYFASSQTNLSTQTKTKLITNINHSLNKNQYLKTYGGNPLINIWSLTNSEYKHQVSHIKTRPEIHANFTGKDLPSEISINWYSINTQRTTLYAWYPLQFLNLSPDLVRYWFNKAIWLHITSNNKMLKF